MKKIIIRVVDYMIFVLCFLFLLSSFFKLISYTCINSHVLYNKYILIIIWIIGLVIAVRFTRPLYHWILHLRNL